MLISYPVSTFSQTLKISADRCLTNFLDVNENSYFYQFKVTIFSAISQLSVLTRPHSDPLIDLEHAFFGKHEQSRDEQQCQRVAGGQTILAWEI